MRSWPEKTVTKVQQFSVEVHDPKRVQLTLSCGHTVWRKIARAKIGSIVVCFECGEK